MTQVLQVDDDEGLTPLDFERGVLADAGAELFEGACTSVEELLERGQDASVLWLAWRPGIDRAVLEGLPNVELVVRWGVGFDQIDVAAATDLGVAVANAPDYGTVDVAEHVIALLLGGSRRIPWYHERMRRGEWPEAAIGRHHRLLGRRLGIIGVGRIGAAVAQRARGIGLEVVGHDPALDDAQLSERGVQPMGLDELLATSDYVSLHMPLNDDTYHFVDADLLAKFKPSGVLVNASRGKVIDTDALLAALASGHLSWAALDVFEEEPLSAEHPLRSVPDIILTPHIAGYSVEAWQDLREEMCLTTVQWLRTGWADRIVNPQVRDTLRARR